MTTDACVTAVTLTKERPALLRRALESVGAQRCTVSIAVLVVCLPDERDAVDDIARSAVAHRFPVTVLAVAEDGSSGTTRVARLRNLAVRAARSRWIAFLDDDNRWEPDHLDSLLACSSATGAGAVHSEMAIFHGDGTPYLERRIPWSRDEAAAAAEFERLAALGVVEPGSNVRHDRVDPDGGPVLSVDTSEWLLDRELLLQVPFPEDYSERDELDIVGEDDKLVRDLVAQGVRIVSTARPTLAYYLGGRSNSFA